MVRYDTPLEGWLGNGVWAAILRVHGCRNGSYHWHGYGRQDASHEALVGLACGYTWPWAKSQQWLMKFGRCFLSLTGILEYLCLRTLIPSPVFRLQPVMSLANVELHPPPPAWVRPVSTVGFIGVTRAQCLFRKVRLEGKVRNRAKIVFLSSDNYVVGLCCQRWEPEFNVSTLVAARQDAFSRWNPRCISAIKRKRLCLKLKASQRQVGTIRLFHRPRPQTYLGHQKQQHHLKGQQPLGLTTGLHG
jgi:hypothetical protein